ncbi:hypothetical protein CTI12_AA277270 [Artemisia annua]|uniref:NB-ARC domains-containing protein n=1 Tax=Artemisia annua TaxID=35608 RepID=A0A2U1NEA2_ARTAN|nr:hypothetical protein CTI12_AA277270 [Artemisia annua]
MTKAFVTAAADEYWKRHFHQLLMNLPLNGGSEVVTVWLKQLKTVVSEADDLLDEVQYEVLRRELSEINKQALELGHQIEQQGPIPNSLRKETHSYLDEFKIVGRENNELQIIELLTESRKEEKLTIVVGMGGIWKTTLAKSVYNNPKPQKRFDVKAWLCVSVKLREEMGSKRYLLVLDDIWDEKRIYLDEFRSCLSDDEGWSMFKERTKPLPELEAIGCDIVKKCCSLPLLVKIIGSMLQNYRIDKHK